MMSDIPESSVRKVRSVDKRDLERSRRAQAGRSVSVGQSEVKVNDVAEILGWSGGHKLINPID